MPAAKLPFPLQTSPPVLLGRRTLTKNEHKRGLLHAHILLILRQDHKPRNATVVDRAVAAEIPDKDDPVQRRLYQVVTTSLMYGPCGPFDPTMPCCDDAGRCTKGFPFTFEEHTEVPDEKYPVYRRRDNGRFVTKRGCQLDNRWVIPYNPYLTSKYGAHINVQVCTSIRAVKYLYKYIHKGYDRAAMDVVYRDEVQEFIDARYVGPSESCWRIFGYPMHGRSHAVERLPVHLPGQHSVLFEEGAEAAAVQQHGRTKLTAYFELVRQGWRAEAKQSPDGEPLFYPDVPRWYSWDAKPARWKPRHRTHYQWDQVIGRMYAVPPQDTDRHFLRSLLMHTGNALDFEGGGGLKPPEALSWRHAAELKGLVENDQEFHDTLEEAALTQMPHLLRRLLVQILVLCEPAEPLSLWEAFQDYLAADFKHRGLPDEQARDSALHDVDLLLHDHGKTTVDVGLPRPVDYDHSEFTNRALRHALDFDTHAAAADRDARVEMLTTEQRTVYDAVIDALQSEDTDHGHAFYVDGPGGSGKTFLYETLIHAVHAQGDIALACAISGIAATLLPGGTTAHSLFGLPLEMPEHGATSSIKAQESRAEVLRRAQLIVWDEASMIPKPALDCVDRLLRDITGCDVPFGAKVILLGGDFRQILPVLPRGSEADVVANTILQHPTMRDGTFRRFTLTRNMRLVAEGRGTESHRDWLLELGEGRTLHAPELHPLATPLPPHLCLPEGSSGAALLDCAYPDVQTRTQECLSAGSEARAADTWLGERAILAPRNSEADALNEAMVARLDAATDFVSLSRDTVVDPENEDSVSYPEEFLHTLQPNGVPPHALHLRRGVVVIVLRNLDKERGICNGVRCVVLSTSARMLDVRVISGPARGQRLFLPRIPFRSSPGELPFILRRRQFPVKVAYAISIHKAQGQSLKHCGVYLDQPVFTHGQLYVSASRATSASGLRFCLGSAAGHGYREDDGPAYGVPHTHNIVYAAVLGMAAATGVGDSLGHGVATPQAAPAADCSSAADHTATTDLAEPTAASAPAVGEGPGAADYVDLTPKEEAVLYQRLLHGTDEQEELIAADAAQGIDADAMSRTCVDDIAADTARARALGVLPSVWHEVAQRPAADRQMYLQAEEELTRSTPGAASSSAARFQP